MIKDSKTLLAAEITVSMQAKLTAQCVIEKVKPARKTILTTSENTFSVRMMTARTSVRFLLTIFYPVVWSLSPNASIGDLVACFRSPSGNAQRSPIHGRFCIRPLQCNQLMLLLFITGHVWDTGTSAGGLSLLQFIALLAHTNTLCWMKWLRSEYIAVRRRIPARSQYEFALYL